MKYAQLGFIMIGLMISSYILGLDVAEKKHQSPEPTISKCDSIQLANDSLRQRIGVLENRIRQYKVGLAFLKDKDKKSYDYVINAGNFIFHENL